MKILVIGCNGQLGHSLAATAPENMDIIGLDLPELDITDATAVLDICRESRPDVVVNAAAYTAVDKAEIRTVRRKLDSRAREIAHEAERLSDWEADLVVRERVLDGLRACRTCGAYYGRNHICPNQWTHCRSCGGYFPKNHRCPR